MAGLVIILMNGNIFHVLLYMKYLIERIIEKKN